MKLIGVLLLSLLVFAWSTPAFAQADETSQSGPVVLTDGQDEYPLGLHLEILEDPGGELTIDDVAAPDFDSRFTSSQVEVPNLGFTDSIYWARLHLRNEARLANRWLLEIGFANSQYVDLYRPLPGGEGFVVKRTGSLRPVSTRDIRYPDIVFELSLPAQSQQTYYLRFENDASMTLPLTIWSPDAFLEHTQQYLLRYGLFFGLMLGLLGYNLFLLFSLREKSYLFLTLFIANMMFFEATYAGFLETYAFPDLYSLKPFYLPLSFTLIFISALLFCHSFLEVRARIPKLHRLFIAILVVWGALILLIPFASYLTSALVMLPWGITSLVTVLATGIISWRQGFRPARFFMFAWLGLLVTIFINLMVRLGLFSSTGFSENAYHLGIMWMVVCWSIALADRINLLKSETEAANRDLRNSEHRLAEILEGLPLGVVVYEKDQKPSFINRRVTEILANPAQGIGPDLSAGRTLAQALKYYSFRVTGRDQAYPLEEFPVYRALEGEQAAVDDVEADLIDRRVPLEIWASPVRDDAGNVESAVVAFQDITVRKQAEAALAEYRLHLERLVEERTVELSDSNERLQLEIRERKTLEQLLYQHIAWLTALHNVRQMIGGATDLPRAYDQLVATILRLQDATAVFLFYWGDRDGQMVSICHAQPGGSAPDLGGISSSFKKESSLRRALELGKPITYSAGQAASLPGPLEALFRADGSQSLILIPMIASQTVTGVFGMAQALPVQDFAPARIELVVTIAQDLNELAQDAQLVSQAQALVAAEERNRLARDLHDSVTQVLFSASLVAEVLPKIWQRDPARALESVEELRRLTRGALAEMRTMLLELRPASVLKTPLPELLAQLTEAITSRIELPFFLYIQQIPALPEDVHTAFYRIAQEALNNTVKHAQASQVTVSLSARQLAGNTKREVKLVIEDDGVGFSPRSEWQEQLGIGIMRERAVAIQATLSINSRPGAGTQVALNWRNELENHHE